MTRPILVIDMPGLTRSSVSRVPRLAMLRQTGFEADWDAEPGSVPWLEDTDAQEAETVNGELEASPRFREAVAAARQRLRTRRPGLLAVRLTGPAPDPVDLEAMLAPLLDEARNAAAAVVVIGADDAPDGCTDVGDAAARPRVPFLLCSDRNAARQAAHHRLTGMAGMADLLGDLTQSELAQSESELRRARGRVRSYHRCPWCTVRRPPAELPGKALR